MHDDILVGKHWPMNEPEPTRWVGYNVWGNRGFFYTPATVPHLSSVKVRPTGQRVPEKRRMQLGDERERKQYKDVEWYVLEDVLEAINTKRAKRSRPPT